MRLVTLSALLLSACTSIVPGTAMRLSGISPTTADPAGFAVDLTLPDGVDVTPGTALLVFAVHRADTGETASGGFTLERDGTIFRVSPDDLDELRALQATARQWNAENDAATDGSLSVSLTPCRIGNGPDVDARIDVGLQMQEGGAFLPLVRNAPLSAVASATQIRDMGDCP